MKYLKTSNQLLIKESVKEVKAYIEQNKDNMDAKTKELANETLAYLDKWFYKSPNLYFTFFRFVMAGLPLHRNNNQLSLFDSFEGFLRWAKDNKATLKALPKPLIQYDNYEELIDDIKRIDTNTKSKAFYQMLKYLGYEYEENDYKNVAIAYGQLSDRYKRVFESVLKYYKTNKQPIKVFIKKVKEHIKNGNRTQEDILKYIKDNNINIIYNKDNIILIQTEQREHIKYLGSPKWCIVYSDGSFNDYLAPETLSTQYIIFNFNLSVTDSDYRFGITIDYKGDVIPTGQQDNLDNPVTSGDIFKVTNIPIELFTIGLRGVLIKQDILEYLKNNNIEIIHETLRIVVAKTDDEEHIRNLTFQNQGRLPLNFKCYCISDIVYENDKCFVCYLGFDVKNNEKSNIYIFIAKSGFFRTPARSDILKLDMNSSISYALKDGIYSFDGYDIPTEILRSIFYKHRKKEDVVDFIKKNNINVVYDKNNTIVISTSDYFYPSHNQLKYFGYVFSVDGEDSFDDMLYRNYYVIINFNLSPDNPKYSFCVLVESDNRISYQKDNYGNDVDLNIISDSTRVPINVFTENSYTKTKKQILKYINDNGIKVVYNKDDMIAVEVKEEHRRYLESPYWYDNNWGEDKVTKSKYRDDTYIFIAFDFSAEQASSYLRIGKYLIQFKSGVTISLNMWSPNSVLDELGRYSINLRANLVAVDLIKNSGVHHIISPYPHPLLLI